MELCLMLHLYMCLYQLLYLTLFLNSWFFFLVVILAFFFKIFIYLATSGLSCSMQDLLVSWGISHCGTRNSLVLTGGLSSPAVCGVLVPRPGMEPMSPALDGRFLTWTTKEVPILVFLRAAIYMSVSFMKLLMLL